MTIEIPADAIAALRKLASGGDPEDFVHDLPLAHLQLRLQPVLRALRAAVAARAERNAPLPAATHGVSSEHVMPLFGDLTDLFRIAAGPADCFALDADECAAEVSLRERAKIAGTALPLDKLAQSRELCAFETGFLMLCVAAQFDLAFGRIYGFIHDDLNRLAPGPQLMALLSDAAAAERLRQRAMLAPHGKLQRFGLLRAAADTHNELEREFVLAPGVLDGLLCYDTDWGRQFADPDEIDTSGAMPLALFPDSGTLAGMVPLLADGQTGLIGLWGVPAAGSEEAAAALAAKAGRSLRRLPRSLPDVATLASSLDMARALGAALLVDADALPEIANGEGLDRSRAAAQLARSAVPLVVIGRQPWRPALLSAGRANAELELCAPSRKQRTAQWQHFAPAAGDALCSELAAEFAFGPSAIRAASMSAEQMGSAGQAGSDGQGGSGPAAALRLASRAVSMRRAPRHAAVIMPRRQPEELILPPLLHRRVLEVATFFRAQSRVDEEWGFGRLLGGGGMKVLMTGDSGTGKTAAAEVIAGQAGEGRPMFKVDLAGVVSKWVGETEKQLDEVFDHAEETHATLFFDEADALFAKRGEVERGSDRYANLEVGFLLQKLEAFSGLAILASNHKDQLDQAFMRRFQVVLHFPRPTAVERRALWQMALPDSAPVAEDVDLAAFDSLDLTGAGIVNAARLAGLLAAGEGEDAEIGMRHLVSAISRQFQHESRLFAPAQMGAYASLVADAA